MKYLYPKNKSGFTMIEMIVSVAIIVFVTSIFLANYHGTNRKSELNLVAQKMVSDIRMAQNYSLSTKELSAGVSVPGGWGVRASSTASSNGSYIIFADVNNNMAYNSASEFYKQIGLPSGITISNIKIGGTTRTLAHVIFLPPDPTTYIGNPTIGMLSNTDIAITLKDLDNNTKTVTVNYLGLIDAN